MTVTIEIPGTWYYGMVGTIVRRRGDRDTVRFDGLGTVTVPATLTRPLETVDVAGIAALALA